MVSRRTDVDIVDKVVVVDDDSVGIGIVVNVIDVIIWCEKCYWLLLLLMWELLLALVLLLWLEGVAERWWWSTESESNSVSTEEESNSFINALRELIRPIVVAVTKSLLFYVDDDADNDSAATMPLARH